MTPFQIWMRVDQGKGWVYLLVDWSVVMKGLMYCCNTLHCLLHFEWELGMPFYVKLNYHQIQPVFL